MSPETHVVKRALISVSDKTGLIEFATELNTLGVEIYSTGGTFKALHTAGLPVKTVEEMTGFPEILDGRVKTLHPTVHAGLLADLGLEDHRAQLAKHAIESIDLLVVNLYPFESTLAKENAEHHELIENIDIGGPTMLRSAAKNYKWTAPIVNPERYAPTIAFMKERGGSLPETFRAELAGDVFTHTARYDSIISGYFNTYNKIETPNTLNLSYNLAQACRYGENPHQQAALYGSFFEFFTKLHGKELSFNNIIDVNAATQIILEFDEPACALVKHTNPCGAAIGANITEAYHKAFATDKVSPYGGIFAFNRPVELETAEAIHAIFAEVIIAPSYSEAALELLTKKKDRRLITCDIPKIRKSLKFDIRSVVGGVLVQEADTQLLAEGEMKVVTKRQPTEAEMQGLMFGWKICKHVKSNAIVYTANDRTLGVGAGQMSRVDSSRIAVEKAGINGVDLKGSIIASDAFFPFADGLIEAAAAGATAVIQPGGSVRDEEVIKAADENNMAMIFTGMRHFKH